jgi:hypothetical protein
VMSSARLEAGIATSDARPRAAIRYFIVSLPELAAFAALAFSFDARLS